MQKKQLIKILRKQHFPRLVFPLLLIILSVLYIIINPFKNSLHPSDIEFFSDTDELYKNDSRYINYKADKLLYTGLDYSVNKKVKANIYYTIENDICYYVIIPKSSGSGIATSLDNYTITAKLIKNEDIFRQLSHNMSEKIGFSISGIEKVSSPVLISEYDYSIDFSRYSLIICFVVLALALIYFIFVLIAFFNPLFMPPVLLLSKYGNRKELFSNATNELENTDAPVAHNVFITDSFLMHISGNDSDIIPIDNISWMYDYNEVLHKKGKTRLHHPLCIITDVKRMYMIKHLSEKDASMITNFLVGKHPEIMVGYKAGKKTKQADT